MVSSYEKFQMCGNFMNFLLVIPGKRIRYFGTAMRELSFCLGLRHDGAAASVRDTSIDRITPQSRTAIIHERAYRRILLGADISLSPWCFIAAGLTLSLVAFVALHGYGALLALTSSVLVAYFVLISLPRTVAAARARCITAQLPQLAERMGRQVAAGGSIEQALQAAVSESECEELIQALRGGRGNGGFVEALEEMHLLHQNPEIRFFFESVM